MPPRKRTASSPAPTRMTRGSATPEYKKALADAEEKRKNEHILEEPSDTASDVYASLRVYFACVGTLLLLLGVLVRIRPAPPAGGECAGVGIGMLLPPKEASIKALWACTKAYQEQNWWFVLAFFQVLYMGIKMLAIPATFTLCVLAGALFPMPLCQLVTGVAEAVGSSLCYLLSKAFLAPVVEYFFSSKLAMMRAKAHEERQYMLSFNFFLRLTPFMPNWMINLSCPLVGVPLGPFFIGSLFGTQLSLLFLALSGATLKEAGETGFNLEKVQSQLKAMGLLMLVLQLVPIGFVALQKRRAAKA